jgi:hypothetical protein
MTAWTFRYTDKRGVCIFQVTTETPTRLGVEHAERCARCNILSRPWIKEKWDGKPGTLANREGANAHRAAQQAAICRIKRESPSRRKFGADFYLPSKH